MFREDDSIQMSLRVDDGVSSAIEACVFIGFHLVWCGVVVILPNRQSIFNAILDWV